jgi:hypothetical protein
MCVHTYDGKLSPKRSSIAMMVQALPTQQARMVQHVATPTICRKKIAVAPNTALLQ